MTDWRDDRIGSALRNDNPSILARLPASFAAIGDVQWLPGYCVLLADDPAATRLSDLPRTKRRQFLHDMEYLGAAVETVCARFDSAFRRINIEILGNADPFLHVHIWPRYDWEPAELVTAPVWLYPRTRWSDPGSAIGPQHEELRAAITRELEADRESSLPGSSHPEQS